MTFKHTSFYESPVMRELVRQDSANNPVIKNASDETKDPLAPGDDLVSDINKLAEGLRTKGFKKEAEELEHNLIIYKIAETHLYKAFDETGEDLINFAHPGPNPNMDEGKSPYGIIEDIFAQHKKMLEIARRDPKPIKTASGSGPIDFFVDIDDYNMIGSSKVLKSTDHVGLKKVMGEILDDLNDKKSKLKDIKELILDSVKNGKSVGSLQFEQRELTDGVKRLEGILSTYKTRYDQLINAFHEARGEKPRLDQETKNIDSGDGKMMTATEYDWWKNNIIGKIDRLLPLLNENDEIGESTVNIFNLLKMSLQGSKNYPEALKSFPKKIQDYSSINKLDGMVMQWEGWLKKKANLNVNVKTALFEPPSSGSVNSVSERKPLAERAVLTPPARQPAVKKTVAPRPSNSNSLSREEFQAVASMQKALNTLVDTFKTKGFKISEQDSATLLSTGFGSGTDQRQTANSVDGRWGPNTTKALQTAQKILNENGVNVAFETQSPYASGKRVSLDDFANIANSNLEKLNQASSAVSGVALTENLEDSSVFDSYFKFTKPDFRTFDSLFNKLSPYEGFSPSNDPDDNLIGWSRSKWLDVLKFLRDRAAKLNIPVYQRSVADLFAKFRSLPKTAFVDDIGNADAVLNAKKMDKLSLAPEAVTLEEQATAFEQAAHTGNNEKSQDVESDGRDSSRFDNILPMPFDTTINVKNFEVNYGRVAKNIDKYKKAIHFLTYRQLFNNISALVRDLRPDVSWSEALYYSNLSPNGQAVIGGKTLTNEAGRAITWGQLESYQQAQTRGLADALKAKAAVISVSNMLQALQSDMIAAKGYYIENGVDNKTIAKKEMVDMEKFYDLWSSAFDACSRNLNSYLKSIKL